VTNALAIKYTYLKFVLIAEKYMFRDHVSINFVTPIEVTRYKRAPVGVYANQNGLLDLELIE